MHMVLVNLGDLVVASNTIIYKVGFYKINKPHFVNRINFSKLERKSQRKKI